jgi:hypothetical protein
MDSVQAYLESAEFHYAADLVSRRDGVSVSYVIERPGFVDAAVTAGELLELHREMVGEAEALRPIPSSMMDSRQELFSALADKVGIPKELIGAPR